MNYTIIRGDASAIVRTEKAPIADVPWGASYTPESFFQGIYVENEGFLFKLTCLEKNPTATMKGACHAVSLDSCLELFLNFAPEKTDIYINFEMNPNGAYLFGIGRDRFGRTDLVCDTMPTVQGEILKESWSVTLMIPQKAIESVYGKIDFAPGYKLSGNAFKCGGKAPYPHHLSWSPVQRNERDFHRSDCFGTLEIL